MSAARSGFITLLLTLIPPGAFAAGWTQAPDSYYAKIWGRGLFGNMAYDLDGELLEVDRYHVVDLQMYGEYGVARDLTVLLHAVPVGTAAYGEERTVYTGPVFVGARRRFLDKKLQMSLEGRIGGSLGFGDSNLAGADDPFEFRPTIRTGTTSWSLQFGFPLSFGWVSWWAGPQVNTRADLSHAFDAGAQLGVQLGQFVIDVHSQLHWTFDRPDVLNVTGVGDTRYLGFGLGFSWWPSDRVGAYLGADGATLVSSNAATIPLQIGVETRR